MSRVKGTMFVEFVKSVKADKSGALESHLTDQDREVLSQQILSSAWYPYETYKNCFNALVKVVAKGDMEQVRQWGHVYCEKSLKNVYKNLIIEGEPLDALKKYGIVTKTFFDFGKIMIEKVSDNEAVLKMSEFDPDFEPFYYVASGWMEKSVELSGAKDVKSEFVSKSWEGAPETAIRISWSV